jgi:hypothetical protein
LVQAWLAAAIARRPLAFLVANLALALAFGVLSLGAADRLVVGGGLERGGEDEAEVVVVLTPKGSITDPVARQAVRVVESGLLADSSVAGVEPLDTDRDAEDTVLVVTIHATPAAVGQSAAERVTDRIDPGPFAVAVGGEPGVQALARDRLESELPGLGLLAAPLILLALGFGFGLRQAAAPVLAAATAALGGILVLRALPDGLDLTAVGIAVAAAVGLAVAIESCLSVRRAHADVAFAAPEAMIADALHRAMPRIGWACAGGALAAATLFAIPLPAAHSAAVGGAAAAVLAAAAAPVAMASVLALLPAKPPAEAETGTTFGERLRSGRAARIADEIAIRPALGWIPALLVLAALGLAASQAFEADPVALAAADLGSDSEPARVAALLGEELPAAEAEQLASGSDGLATDAADLFRSRLPWLLGAITLAGLIAAYLASRSLRASLAHGIGSALPAGATCGLLALSGDGSLPFEHGPIEAAPHLSVLLATLAALGAVGVARAALADPRAAVVGTVVAGAALGVLAGAELDAVAQLGIAIAAGLVIDLVLVRAVLAPCLERALPDRLA